MLEVGGVKTAATSQVKRSDYFLSWIIPGVPAQYQFWVSSERECYNTHMISLVLTKVPLHSRSYSNPLRIHLHM
jgi:hypothetical protein